MASTLFRAIVTGFGLKLGSEIAKVFSQKLSDMGAGGEPRTTKAEEEDEDDMPPTTTADPPSFDGQ